MAAICNRMSAMISAEDYHTAFIEYLRKGTPIRLARKENQPAVSYVWRSTGDNRVRLDHRYYDGRIFRRDDPDMPLPGEEYGCRCHAEPYVEGATEFAAHDLPALPAPKTNG